MRLSGKQTKRAVSLLLCLALLISMTAFALSVRAEEVDDLADTGADTYYLWGENSNSPDFNASTPTGTFTYDSSKGYYYYDLTGSSGDYCFVVSTIGNSANYAVKSPAVQSVASSGSYYLSAGNYHGYNCMHLWNPSGDAIRIYFTSASAGLNAVKAGSEVATQAPTATQAPATQASTQKPTSAGGTTPTTAQNPTQSQQDTGKTYVYCENEAGWSAVYAYMWNSESDKNASWPGVKMTNIGGNIWRYEYTKSYAKIIFNVGSNQTQTSDLTFPGKDYIFNNKTNSWEVYDTSPLQVSSFTTDLEAPQYNGVGIILSAAAEGQGTVYYKFSVTGSTGTQTLSDYSTKNSVQWIPQTAGTYTLTYDFKDAAGNTNQRTKTYVIEDGLTSVAPYIKTVSPAPGEIENNKTVSVNVTAGGGITGTNLLFYKFTVKDSSGNTVNTPYYTLSGNYSFKPSSLGAYSLTVDVQGSDNKTVERTYNYTSVGALSPTETPETQPPTTYAAPTDPPKPTEAAKPTDPVIAVLYGDADDDGDVTILDATYVQRYEANVALPTPLNERNADVDGDDEVSIIDATLIQRFNAGVINKFPAES
ncbi:MAG: starch-binding protein [Ruminococcus sp.]|nr:starch-binding protein [Ruminococcus sp.]